MCRWQTGSAVTFLCCEIYLLASCDTLCHVGGHNSEMNCIVFLDFDGVEHPDPAASHHFFQLPLKRWPGLCMAWIGSRIGGTRLWRTGLGLAETI
jgi:hypothetical protein